MSNVVRNLLVCGVLVALVLGMRADALGSPPPFNYITREQHDLSEVFKPKIDVMVTMRDGVKLHTEVYIPKNAKGPMPVLLERTPYYANPGEQEFSSRLNLYSEFFEHDYIIVLQDLRGRFESEGEHISLRPVRDKSDPDAIDESTDFYDTIDWIVNNVPGNSGNVGTLGISYGGFLSLRAMIDPHPALKAVQPGASCADMFIGDDFHHNGAFRLDYSFAAAVGLDLPGQSHLMHGVRDAYSAFLEMGPLANVNKKYLKGKSRLWNAFEEHPNLDDTWRYEICGVLPHVDEVTVPALHVLGWYDMEDFYGPTEVYKKLEKKDHDNNNFIVFGPWDHGGWTFDEKGDRLGPLELGSETSRYFRKNIRIPFFNYYLKGEGNKDFPEAIAYQMGSNQWQEYEQWPPEKNIEQRTVYLQPDGRLSFDKPIEKGEQAFDSYVSDPNKPVPYRARPFMYPWGWATWMLEDQRFVDGRPDVLTWVSEPLQEDISITGHPIANLFASTTGTAADWVVKLIDVHPDDFSQWEHSGYQMNVGAEVFRARYRNSYEIPEPVVANRVTPYQIDLRSRNHRFLKGHRIMVQIQSSWFPVIDRNPQTYVPNIFFAGEGDFQKQEHRVYRSREYPTSITLPVNTR